MELLQKEKMMRENCAFENQSDIKNSPSNKNNLKKFILCIVEKNQRLISET